MSYTLPMNINNQEDLHRITRCTSSINKAHHNWEQYNLLDDICTECGEIAFGTANVGGIVYPETSCPGKPQK